MGKRKFSNPLALAVLALLAEKPMHPYEMSSTLRERAKEQSIKLNYGSLYSVVEALVRHKLIDVRETVREGKRPERTIYAITEPGRIEFVEWLAELLAVPVKEFPQFEAALSLMPAMSPDEVARLLEGRLIRLEAEIAAMDGVMAAMAERDMPYLWSIEADYAQVLRRAEQGFVHDLVTKIRNGDFPELAAWRQAHVESEGGVPNETDWEKALQMLPKPPQV